MLRGEMSNGAASAHGCIGNEHEGESAESMPLANQRRHPADTFIQQWQGVPEQVDACGRNMLIHPYTAAEREGWG